MAWFTAHQAKVFMVENFGNVCADYYRVEEVTYDAYSDEVSMSIVTDGN